MLGLGVSDGARWHEEHLPSSTRVSRPQRLGSGQAAYVTTSQTPPSLSLPSTNSSPKYGDDGIGLKCPEMGRWPQGAGQDGRRFARSGQFPTARTRAS